MLGDAADMARRLRAVLPAGWFSDTSPVLDGVLAGLASAWAGLFQLLQQVKVQTRIATATDAWLDRVALDFFGNRVRREAAETDAAFRVRVLQDMQTVRVTRAALLQRLNDLTGRQARICEPANPGDTGAWARQGAWGGAGAWGSLELPFQYFVTAYRPAAGDTAADAQILATVLDTIPVGSICWMQISD